MRASKSFDGHVELLEKLLIQDDQIGSFIVEKCDSGGYYAPTIENGVEYYIEDPRDGVKVGKFQKWNFPNSSISIHIERRKLFIEGHRGSVSDMIVPELIRAGIDIKDPNWKVVTTAPDVPWYSTVYDWQGC